MTAPRPLPARIWVLWCIASVVGVAVIALPDDDNRLFSLSASHGPSPLDGIGILILLAGWLLLTAATLSRWRQLMRLESRWLLAGALVYAIGVMVLVPGVLLDLGLWWLVGAVVMSIVQIGAAVAVSR